MDKLNIEGITDKDLFRAKVSKREFEQIKALIKLDESLFRPPNIPSQSPHLDIIDIGKYENIPYELKEILYRPPKVKLLYEKYWELQKVC